MAQVILFGGGDGGGLIITPNGVRRIPPFNPLLLSQLRATSLLVSPGSTERSIESVVTKLSNFVVEKLEGVLGPLDESSTIVYDDPDGGFTCGTTGKPPIPIPHPNFLPPIASELFARGTMNEDIIAFGRAVKAQNVPLAEAFEDPERLSERLGVTVSPETAAALRSVAPSQLEKVADPVDREVLAYFHKVVEDGRFVQAWALQPAEISRELGVELSSEALDRVIVAGGSQTFDPAGPVSNVAIVAVVVGVVIMLVPTEAGRSRLSVRDLSQQAKF